MRWLLLERQISSLSVFHAFFRIQPRKGNEKERRTHGTWDQANRLFLKSCQVNKKKDKCIRDDLTVTQVKFRPPVFGVVYNDRRGIPPSDLRIRDAVDIEVVVIIVNSVSIEFLVHVKT